MTSLREHRIALTLQRDNQTDGFASSIKNGAIPALRQALQNRQTLKGKFRLSVGQYGYPARVQNRKPLRDDYAAHADALLDQLTRELGGMPADDARLQLPDHCPRTLM